MTNLDVIALQIGATGEKNFKPYETMTDEQEILVLVSSGKFEKAIEKCDELLKKSPLNFVALMEKSFSYMKLNKPDAAIQKEKFMQVVNAIFWSGNGSIEHPYFVLGPSDGQFIIRYILGKSIGIMASGQDKNKYFIDILELKDDSNSKTLHFIINQASSTIFNK